MRAKTSVDPAGLRDIQFVTKSGQVDMDPMHGEQVSLSPKSGVDMFAPGMRNPFGCVFASSGKYYCTDNGANVGYGSASTGPTTSGALVDTLDSIASLVPYDLYKKTYGYANRAWAANGGMSINNIYIGPQTKAYCNAQGECYAGKVIAMPSAITGLTEYRSTAFGGSQKGSLITNKYKGGLYWIKMTADGESGTQTPVAGAGIMTAIDVTHIPGGAIATTSYTTNKVMIATPNDPAAATGNMLVYDIFPWRSPAVGGNKFIIGGNNFGTSAEVTIGGVAATVTRVSKTRIVGVLPAGTAASTMLDVRVVSTYPGGGQKAFTLKGAFRYLGAPGSEPWTKQ
jgi:hypothetical protein